MSDTNWKNPKEKPVPTFGEGYEVLYEPPSVEEYLHIREAAGLGRKDPDGARIGLENSFFSVQVRHNGTLIAFSRLISDGGLWYVIVDTAILPAYQKDGTGRFMIESLIHHFYDVSPPGGYLMTITGVPGFGEKVGMTRVEPPEVGMYAWKPI